MSDGRKFGNVKMAEIVIFKLTVPANPNSAPPSFGLPYFAAMLAIEFRFIRLVGP